MASITAAAVKALRDRTGLPMMECKKALTECDGNDEAAIELLSRKYKGKMDARSDRETGEGRIGLYLSDDKKTGAIIELRCETAPVAKTEVFISLANTIAKVVANQADAAPATDSVLATKTDAGQTINELVVDAYSKIQENMNLTQCRKITGGHLAHYVHHDGKSGVLLALDTEPSAPEVGVDLAQHTMFTRPLAITRDDLPAEAIAKVERDARAAAEEEGKPAGIIDKIIPGKVNAFCAENALVEQEHVKPDYDKKPVKDVLKAAGVSAVTDLAIMIIGE